MQYGRIVRQGVFFLLLLRLVLNCVVGVVAVLAAAALREAGLMPFRVSEASLALRHGHLFYSVW